MLAALFVLTPAIALAQPVDTLGTRAAGMGGAFVAVVDDASAVYWNPGALAKASYFSLVIDRGEGQTGTEEPSAGSRSGFLIALAAPSLGLSYYRLRATSLAPPDFATEGAQLGRNVIRPGEVRLETLVTHHAGATFVQSITAGLSVGATLKLVRGTAGTAIVTDGDREELLAEAAELPSDGQNRFDADIGVLAALGPVRVGLVVRNVTEPEFDTRTPGRVLGLSRQARAGFSVPVAPGWMLAADADLLETDTPFGERRDVAVGTEFRLGRRVFARTGVRINTLDDGEQGGATSVGFGGSYAVKGSFLVDAQVTTGSERSVRGWGISGRFVY